MSNMITVVLWLRGQVDYKVIKLINPLILFIISQLAFFHIRKPA